MLSADTVCSKSYRQEAWSAGLSRSQDRRNSDVPEDRCSTVSPVWNVTELLRQMAAAASTGMFNSGSRSVSHDGAGILWSAPNVRSDFQTTNEGFTDSRKLLTGRHTDRHNIEIRALHHTRPLLAATAPTVAEKKSCPKSVADTVCAHEKTTRKQSLSSFSWRPLQTNNRSRRPAGAENRGRHQ